MSSAICIRAHTAAVDFYRFLDWEIEERITTGKPPGRRPITRVSPATSAKPHRPR
ncbi:MAG: hypothetical protein GF403_11250 [Candidatus Coatesbacteria bacterium]|nr:hypothetical protein [Candidatus Coatesbacteria bacterium]